MFIFAVWFSICRLSKVVSSNPATGQTFSPSPFFSSMIASVEMAAPVALGQNSDLHFN